MLDQQLLIGTVFLAGLASFLSPCIFPIIPIYFGILSKGGKKVLNTFLFILGLSLTFVSLGFSFGFLGNIFQNRLFFFENSFFKNLFENIFSNFFI